MIVKYIALADGIEHSIECHHVQVVDSCLLLYRKPTDEVFESWGKFQKECELMLDSITYIGEGHDN